MKINLIFFFTISSGARRFIVLTRHHLSGPDACVYAQNTIMWFYRSGREVASINWTVNFPHQSFEIEISSSRESVIARAQKTRRRRRDVDVLAVSVIFSRECNHFLRGHLDLSTFGCFTLKTARRVRVRVSVSLSRTCNGTFTFFSSLHIWEQAYTVKSWQKNSRRWRSADIDRQFGNQQFSDEIERNQS